MQGQCGGNPANTRHELPTLFPGSAEADPAPCSLQSGGLLWRPNHDTSTNFGVRFRVEPRRRSRPKPPPTDPPRIVRLMQLADEWQRTLDTGEVRNRAELARRAGVSGMWVTNVLALLEAAPGDPGVGARAAAGHAGAVRDGAGTQGHREASLGTSGRCGAEALAAPAWHERRDRRAAELRPVMIVEEPARADRNRAARHSDPTGASIPAGGILTSMAQPKHMPEPVPAALKPLVDQLAKLTSEQRRLVVEAAEQTVQPREFVGLSEQDIQRLTGVVAIGGNALEDCDALYDG